MEQTTSKLPRGIRNNNPLNIRQSADCFLGQTFSSTDKTFKQFVTLVYGYRAAFKIIKTYIEKYHLTTIHDIIKRWAPDSENNTQAYIDYVSKVSGFAPNAPLCWSNQDAMISIVEAMAEFENGCRLYHHTTVKSAYEMAMKI